MNNFEALKNRCTTINVPEIWKIVKEYDFDNLLNQDEHKILMKNVCIEYCKQKNELT